MATGSRHLLPALLLAGILMVIAAPTSRATDPGVYWGANIGDHLTGGAPPYDMAAADKFEAMTGKSMSLIEFSLPWAHCDSQPCTFDAFPTKQMDAIRQHGAIPVFGWASYSQPLTEDEPAFRLAKIIDGDYDAFIRQWAADARAWGHPFFLNFNWEMNLAGIWPYVETVNGNSRGEYVKAWRHVHDIVAGEGATNATWVWCPNSIYDAASANIAPLYPGDEYVDWTCIDAYNWPWRWQSFLDTLGPTYDLVQTVAPDKPILMGETSTTEKGGSKATWIRDMLGTHIPSSFPNLKGFVWFEKKEAGLNPDSPTGWELESSPSSLAAFAEGIASPLYAGAAFSGLDTSPIPPLTPVARPPAPSNDGTPPVVVDGPCATAAQRRTAACRIGSVILNLKTKPRITRTLKPTLPTDPRGASFSFRLTTQAQVTLSFARFSKRRYRAVPGSVTLPMTQGKRGIAFSGRLGPGQKLKPGRYVVTFDAVDGLGRRATSTSGKFTLRPRTTR